jgi:hypothetical protein
MLYIIPPYILFMGYIFVYDNVVLLYVSNIIWEECNAIMSIACINYIKQTELIANIEEDIERLFMLELHDIYALSHAQLYFLSNHINTLTASGLIGVYNLLHNKHQYSFTECKNISSSIVLLLPHITNTIALTGRGTDLIETINNVKSLFDSNVHENGYICIY